MDIGIERINQMFPVGTFVTLPPSYTNERGAVLRVVAPFRLSQPDINNSTWLTGSFDCYWPDGGYRQFPNYLIWHASHLHIVLDKTDDEAWAMRALAEFSDVSSTKKSKRCTECGKWMSVSDVERAAQWKKDANVFKPNHGYYSPLCKQLLQEAARR